MNSEHYEMGFKDGLEGHERKLLSSPVWQHYYDEGYNDGYDKRMYSVQEAVRTITYRGGC